MEIFSPLKKSWQKEFFDQSLHLAYGMCLIAGFYFKVPLLLAFFLMMAVAFLRELEQHDWDWTRVGRRDLLFFALSGGIFSFCLWLIG